MIIALHFMQNKMIYVSDSMQNKMIWIPFSCKIR